MLITGADGFVGSRLCEKLTASGHSVIRAIRGADRVRTDGKCLSVGDIERFSGWRAALRDVDVVIHLAARAHRTERAAASALQEFRRVNVEATTNVFRGARDAGVGRFVFTSSIGVHGTSSDGRPIREVSRADPAEPYARSKWEAEQALRALAGPKEPRLVVVRPALVYGAGAKGNFLRLMRVVASGWPLPLGRIEARRNYLGLGNFCALLELCAFAPCAAGETFVAADPWSVDLPALLTRIAGSMGRRARLWSLPPALLRGFGRLVGRSVEVARLTSSLEVDSSKARRLLDWRTVTSFDEEIDRMVRAFVDGR